MRQRTLLVVALAVLVGCHSKEKRESKQSARAITTDPTVRIGIESNGPIVFKQGVLIVPCRVTNQRDRFIQVFFDRSQVEDTNGDRHSRRPASSSTCTVGPGRSETFKLIFGDTKAPLPGNSFRVWLWIQPTDGSGVIEGVPPLVVGDPTSFAAAPQGFTQASPPKDMLPPPTEPPPQVQPVPPGTETYACPTCGEPRPKGSQSCPHCGLP